jgi:hypothetical protein
MNGFEATASVHEVLGSINNSNLGASAKASYSFAANDVTGKVWVGGTHKKIQTSSLGGTTMAAATAAGATYTEIDSQGGEVGAKLGFGAAELVGYYYNGKNLDGGAGVAINTLAAATAVGQGNDNHGGYIQATYALPTKTKIGASWGTNIIERNGQAGSLRDAEREAWIVGAYHPLTKHLNLVAEYNHLKVTSMTNLAAGVDVNSPEGKAKTVSLGAILFF